MVSQHDTDVVCWKPFKLQITMVTIGDEVLLYEEACIETHNGVLCLPSAVVATMLWA